MIIANPLYDVVFKYLMEDIDIAREILETILGEKILYLEVKPQETVTEVDPDGQLHILRFDFKATIESPTGEPKKVLIKLNISRYKCYDLGGNYNNQDKLKDVVILLKPNTYLIQAYNLPLEAKTKLERVLHIFNPKFKTKDEHKIDFTDTIDEPIVQKILYRLLSALVDDKVRRNMYVEDEIQSILKRKANEKAAKIAVQKRMIEEAKGKVIEAEKQNLTDTDQAKERKVRSLICYSNLSDAQIASATTSTLYFVQKHRYDLITD